MTSRTMRAMVVSEFGRQPELTEVPRPIPKDDEVLLRVRSAGVCHTDMKIRDGLVPDVSLPVTLGHEIAGVVESVGPGVRKVRVGERGIPYGYVTCGSCRFCIRGRTSLCEDLALRYGFGAVGGYSEFVLVPERFFVPVPDEVSLERAAVASCSVVTAYHSLERGRLRAGETAVVVGAGGGVGLHAVQLASRMGAYVIAVDVDPEREPYALEQGANAFVAAGSSGFDSAIRELTGGLGADVVVDAVAADSTMTGSISALGPGGRLVLVGYRPSEPIRASTPDVVFREIEIIGSHWATMNDLIQVVDMIRRSLIDPIIIRTFPLEEAPAALELLAVGGGPGRSVLTL